ncbi:TniQ family protein, partial [Alishewanella sp. 16-MA]
MKKTKNPLLFYPMPKEGESFKGYIMRLGNRNGFTELKRFLYLFGIIQLPKRIFIVGTNEYYQFLNIISESSNIQKDELDAFFAFEKEVQTIDDFSSEHVHLDTPQICPFCLAEDQYLKRDWQSLYFTHCYKHESKLWDRCLNCKKSFVWEGKLFVGCTNCNFKWSHFRPLADTFLPASQKSLGEASGECKLNLMKTIKQHLKFGLRPFDASFQNLRDIKKYVPDLEPHIEFAYQLAHSNEVLAELKKARKKHWQNKTSMTKNLAILKQVEVANDEWFNQVGAKTGNFISAPTTPKEASHMILTAHRRLNVDEDKACLELLWDQVCSVLNLNEKHVKELIKQSTIPGRMHKNSPKKVSPCRIDDLALFYNIIKKIAKPLELKNDAIQYKSYIAWGNDRALAKHKLNTKKLVGYVLSGDISLFAPDNDEHLFDDFCFCE